MRLFVAPLLLLVVLLAACGQNSSSAGVEVVLRLESPGPAQGASRQGFAGEYSLARVAVYPDGRDLPVQRVEIQRSYAANTAKIYLDPGQTYRFETSLLAGDVIVAWGEQTQVITASTSVLLRFSALARDLELEGASYIVQRNRIAVPLRVLGPNGSEVPLDDLDPPSFTVTGGQIAAQSKLGLEVIPDSPDQPVEIGAELTALTGVRSRDVLRLVRPLRVVAADLIAGDAQSLWVALRNADNTMMDIRAVVPTPRGSQVELLNQRLSSGSVTLPGGRALAERGLLQTVQTWKAGAGYPCAWPRLPEASVTEVSLEWSFRGQVMHTVYGDPPAPVAEAALNGGYAQTRRTLLFSTSDLEIRTGCDVGGGRSTYRVGLALKRGWNWVTRTSAAGATGGFAFALSTDDPAASVKHWYGLFSDASVSLQTDPISPALHQPFAYRLTLRPGSLYSRYQTVTLEGVLTYNPDIVRPASVYGTLGGPQGVRTECIWNKQPGAANFVNFKCEFTRDEPVTLSIPMTAPGAVGPIPAAARIDRTTYLDSNGGNDQAQLEFSPGQPAVQVSADAQRPEVGFYSGDTQPLSPRAGQPVGLVGYVMDNTGIARVEVYEGYSLRGLAGVSGQRVGPNFLGRWAFDWTPSEAGPVTLRAVAYDLAGNATTTSVEVGVGN